MAIWVILIIVLFLFGSMKSVQPTVRESRLEILRRTARKQGLNPKLVPCPDWIWGQYDEKGRGMIAQYGIITPDTDLPACDYQIIDGKWRPFTGQFPANFALDQQPIDIELPDSIAKNVRGISFRPSNTTVADNGRRVGTGGMVWIYWLENIGTGKKSLANSANTHSNNPPPTLETTENDLIQLKHTLEHYIMQVANSYPKPIKPKHYY